MNPNVTTEYRAQVTLDNNTIATITSGDQSTLQAIIQALITQQAGPSPSQKAQTAHFEPQSDGRTTFIFHGSHLDGTQPLGWICEQNVPASMSVRAITQQTRQLHKVA